MERGGLPSVDLLIWRVFLDLLYILGFVLGSEVSVANKQMQSSLMALTVWIFFAPWILYQFKEAYGFLSGRRFKCICFKCTNYKALLNLDHSNPWASLAKPYIMRHNSRSNTCCNFGLVCGVNSSSKYFPQL